MMLTRNLIVLLTLVFVTSPVKADESGYGKLTSAFIQEVAQPFYLDAHAKAVVLSNSISKICIGSNESDLEQSRQAFAVFLRAWAATEIIRFGPVRKANRLERIFFWPDVRSRGLKQVRKLLYKYEKTQSLPDFQTSSVAVQGIPALEYLLFDQSSDDGFSQARCQYSKAIANNIEQLLQAISIEWSASSDYIEKLQSPESDNQFYKSEKEVAQEIFKSLSEAILIVKNIKLAPALDKEFAKAKPKKAPLWRSNLTLTYIDETLVSLQKALASMGLEGSAGSLEEFDFELRQFRSVLNELLNNKKPWEQIVYDQEGYEALEYMLLPLGGMEKIVSVRIPEALGLKIGFNSLDGD